MASGSTFSERWHALTGERTAMKLLNGERWWGGRVADGYKMPFEVGSSVDLREHWGSQAASVLVSSRGRVAWSAEPFRFELGVDDITFDLDVSVDTVGATLRDAVRWCAAKVHETPARMPNVEMFSPQWALWIELLYTPTQTKTLEYAQAVLDHGYRPGVMMIDDNWSEDYGVWKFRPDLFPDPKAMVDELHERGFAVMLWVCPYISPDGLNYLDLRDHGLLIRDLTGEPVIRKWWNGYSAVLDLTNPAAIGWLRSELRSLQDRFGIDGFKFDGGDVEMYRIDDITSVATTPSDQVHRYGLFAAEFEFTELRAGWNLGGLGVAARLSDANHSWDEHGIGKLIGNQLAQGLLGMPFGAPDMIGGGQYLDFDEDRLDPEVFVRHAQIAAFSPMMQFSAAPWRVLDPAHARAVRAAADLRSTHQERIIELAHQSIATGDPIMRPLEYEFPHCGLAEVVNSFLVGPNLLVAPVIERGATSRAITLPPGTWEDSDGTRFEGGRVVEVDVDLTSIPTFRLLAP